jgi:hypothetical protein
MKQIEKGYYIQVSTRKGKKYDIYTKNKEGKYDYLLSFGSALHQQYKDQTPLQAFSHLNHYDLKRRSAYYKRHGITSDKTSAKYFSNKYLW